MTWELQQQLQQLLYGYGGNQPTTKKVKKSIKSNVKQMKCRKHALAETKSDKSTTGLTDKMLDVESIRC